MREFDFKVNGSDYKVKILSFNEKSVTVNVNGTKYEVEVKNKESKTPIIKRVPVVQSVVERGTLTSRDSGQSLATVKAPIPGLILKISVKAGDKVSLGQTLLVLEAMKMQNDIQASKEGTVKEVLVKEGQSVFEGDILVRID